MEWFDKLIQFNI